MLTWHAGVGSFFCFPSLAFNSSVDCAPAPCWLRVRKERWNYLQRFVSSTQHLQMLSVIQVVKAEDDDFQEFQDASKSGSLDDSFPDFQGDVAGSSKAGSAQQRSR